jgi:hypothetical protein
MADPDPETPEWPVAWAAKEVLRRHLGVSFDRRLPQWIATAKHHVKEEEGELFPKAPQERHGSG